MKTKLFWFGVGALLLLVIGAANVLPGFRIKIYPNDSNPPDDSAFIMEETTTNKHVTMAQLRYRLTNGLATTGFVNQASKPLRIQTNGTTVAYVTNVNFVNGITGKVDVVGGLDSPSVSLGLIFSGGFTNFINLSVQAAKLPSTNYPGIDAGNQNWETLYYHTNAENAVANLSAVWQFIVPPDYATNSGRLHIQHTLLATNGPNSSNVVWTVDCIRSHSGDNINLHTGSFGVQVSGTNTWAQSSTIVNAQTDLVVNLNTNLMWQAGDLVVLRLTRNSANDTYRNTGVALVGLQVEYTRQ